MVLNSIFSLLIRRRLIQIDQFKSHPHEVQQKVMDSLLEAGQLTQYGKDNGIQTVSDYKGFQQAIPLQTYTEFKPYVDRLMDGEQGVLWPTEVKWFAKSSGTTTGKSKFIPITKESLQDCHYKGGKDLLSLYVKAIPTANLYSGKHLIVGGSAKLNELKNGAYYGDLSAIVVKNLPFWVERRRTPGREIALMSDWDDKIEKMAYSTIKEDVCILAGVPSWTLVLLKRVLEITGKTDIHDIWPNLEFFMHGGVNFEPYRIQYDSVVQ